MDAKANILGVAVDMVTMEQALEKIEGFMDEKKGVLIATANAEMIMGAQKDAELKEILSSASLVVPDGAGAVWAANFLGYDIKERVAGVDMVERLLKKAPQKKRRIFFFGSAPGVANKAKTRAEEIAPGVEIVGTRSGFFNPEEEKGIIEDIKSAQADLLLVALGVPKQEKWLHKHLSELNVGAAIGVGGTFDVMAGTAKRAPKWMQKAKLEWLFRGLMQPSRIGRLMALPRFVWAVVKSKK